MTLWRRESTSKLVMIEVQKISHELAKRSILHNKLQERVKGMGTFVIPVYYLKETSFHWLQEPHLTFRLIKTRSLIHNAPVVEWNYGEMSMITLRQRLESCIRKGGSFVMPVQILV